MLLPFLFIFFCGFVVIISMTAVANARKEKIALIEKQLELSYVQAATVEHPCTGCGADKFHDCNYTVVEDRDIPWANAPKVVSLVARRGS